MIRWLALSIVVPLFSGCVVPGDANTSSIQIRSNTAPASQARVFFAQPCGPCTIATAVAYAHGCPDSIPAYRHFSAPISKHGEFSLTVPGYFRPVAVWLIPPLPISIESDILFRIGTDPSQTFVIRYRESGANGRLYQVTPEANLRPATSIAVTRTEESQPSPGAIGRTEKTHVFTLQLPKP